MTAGAARKAMGLSGREDGQARRGIVAAIVLVWLLAVTAAFPSPAAAQTLPPLTGRVVDTAGLLDPATEASLDAQLAAFEQQSSDQVVVATVPDLQGEAIEEFSIKLARAWKLGQAGEDNGVLLLVSKGDRKVRIEVGYGLEGTLTDALTQVIIQEDILPSFRAGDYPGGIRKGADGILKVLSGDVAGLQARADARSQADEGMSTETALNIGLFGLVWFAILGAGMMTLLARRFGRKVGPNRWLWLGTVWSLGSRRRSSGTGGFSGGGGSSSGGFSGGGGSFGGGGSSGSW